MATFHIEKAQDLRVGDTLALPFEQYLVITHLVISGGKVRVRTRAGVTRWGIDDEVSVQNTTRHNLVGMRDGDLTFRGCEYCGEEDVSEQELCPEAPC